MAIYYIIIFMLLCGILLDFWEDNAQVQQFRNWWYKAVASILVFLAAFREDVGVDYQHYKYCFETCFTSDEYDELFEPGFMWLTRFIQEYTGDFYIFQMLIAGIGGAIIFAHIYKYTKYRFLILLVYFVDFYTLLHFEVNRQMLATAILCIGYQQFVAKKHFIMWCLCVLLAMQFHRSALVILPLYFSDRISSPSPAWVWGGVAAAFLLVFLPTSVMQRFMDLGYMLGLEVVDKKIDAYAESSFGGSAVKSGWGARINFCFLFVLAYLYSVSDEATRKKTHAGTFLLGTLLFACGGSFFVLIRLASYYLVCGCGYSFYQLFFENKQRTIGVLALGFGALFSMYVVGKFYLLKEIIRNVYWYYTWLF